VDVQWHVRRQGIVHRAHRVLGYRAQAVEGAADAQRGALLRAQYPDQPQEPVDVVPEAPLPLRQWSSIEATRDVQHRQQGQADAGLARGVDQRARHCCRIGVGLSVGRVVQVVELADAAVARLEHLDVQLRRNRLQRIRVEAPGHPVHGLAPGPERVVRAVRVVAAALGQPGHCPLEGVRVQVGNRRQSAGRDVRRRRGAPAVRGPQCVRLVHRAILGDARDRTRGAPDHERDHGPERLMGERGSARDNRRNGWRH
jgi:hypothetical protein